MERKWKITSNIKCLHTFRFSFSCRRLLISLPSGLCMRTESSFYKGGKTDQTEETAFTGAASVASLPPVQPLLLVTSREQQLSLQAHTLPPLPIRGYKSGTDFHRGNCGNTQPVTWGRVVFKTLQSDGTFSTTYMINKKEAGNQGFVKENYMILNSSKMV